MSGVYNWIYADYKDNIWKFTLSDNKKLSYRIMYSEGKWTKETIIDIEVLGFAIHIDENEKVHVVYSNTKGELRYCTMKDKQWVGKTFYKIDSDEFEVKNLKVEIIGIQMHIFYLLVGNDGSDHGILMHCIWTGEEVNSTLLQDIILMPNLKEYYSVHVNKQDNIYVYFITDEGDEISLNYCSFENHMWSPIKRLYGIQGEDIEFEVIIDKQYIHILNRSREESVYFLDYVCVDTIGNIKYFRVHESRKKLDEPILFIEGNKLCSCWIEEDKIFYSIYNGEKWDDSVYFDRRNELKLEIYNCFICIDKEDYPEYRKVYGTNGLDLYLFDPIDFVIDIKDSLKEVSKESKKPSLYEKDLIEKLKLELYRVKSENKSLENKIVYLNQQGQKNQNFIKGYDEKISKLVDQKRKAEENCDMLLELQNKSKKEKEYLNQELLEEKKNRGIIEIKLKNFQDEIWILKQKIEKINEDKKNLIAEKQIFSEEKNKLIEEKDILIEEKYDLFRSKQILHEEKEKLIEEKNNLIEEKDNLIEEKKKLDEERQKLIEEKEILIEEKNKLIKELELERNQSVMDRLLRRRISGSQSNL